MPAPTTITIGGVTASIFAEGYRKGEALQGGPWREILYDVPWDQSDDFIDGLFGGGIKITGGVGGTIARGKPHQYPGNAILYCVSAEGEPVGVPRPDAKLFASDLCRVRARYEVPPFDIGGGDTLNTLEGHAVPWGSCRVNSKTVIEQVPPGAIYYDATGDNPTQKFPLRVNHEEIVFEYQLVPEINVVPLRALVKTLNAATFMYWSRGCVMFDDYDFDLGITSGGTRVEMVRLKFLARAIDWNKRLKDEDFGYDVIKGSLTGSALYPYSDLSGLLSLFSG
jgi:hypothetical protein